MYIIITLFTPAGLNTLSCISSDCLTGRKVQKISVRVYYSFLAASNLDWIGSSWISHFIKSGWYISKLSAFMAYLTEFERLFYGKKKPWKLSSTNCSSIGTLNTVYKRKSNPWTNNNRLTILTKTRVGAARDGSFQTVSDTLLYVNWTVEENIETVIGN